MLARNSITRATIFIDYVWLLGAAPPDPAFPVERTEVNHVGFQRILREFSILRQIKLNVILNLFTKSGCYNL